MGTRAFSHDSIFIPDGQAEDEQDSQALSQECIVGKVRSLQQQLAGNIHFGQPPTNVSGKRMQDLDARAEHMEDTQSSPMEIFGDHDMGLLENADLAIGSPGSMNTCNVPHTEHKGEEKVTPVKMSRPKRPLASSGTIQSINLDAVPRSIAHLDNSAAKHKLSVKPKNQRVSKKHRGMSMSQDYPSIEDTEFEHEHASIIDKSPDKTTYHLKEKLKQDLGVSELLNRKRLEEQRSDQVKTLTEKPKVLIEQKPQNPINLKHEYERRCLEEENKIKLEAQKRIEEEEQKKQEILKENEIKEQQRQEEERKQRAEQALKELEELKRQEEQMQRELEEKRLHQQAEAQRIEEERQRKEEEEKKVEQQKQKNIQEQGMLEKEDLMTSKETKKQGKVCFAEPLIAFVDEAHEEDQLIRNEAIHNEEELKQKQQKQIEAQQQERIGKELRWQELDQRQRPFTFKVSSGEKQIIFEKVHLSPVIPLKEPSVHPDTQCITDNKPSVGSHTLQSTQCVPHTAILVTGAQLCGTAVNLNQIKDTACKSLLGLTEEKNPPSKNEIEKQDIKQISAKTKYMSESLDSQAFLAEWASIRSKILSKSENVNVLDQDRRTPHVCDELTAQGKDDSHNNLRKTMSASAKFSITPAWQKFAESVHSRDDISDNLAKQCIKDNVAAIKSVLSEKETQESTTNIQETVTIKKGKQVTIEDNTEGYIFSKDLPSFLVPNPPQSPRRVQVENQNVSLMGNGVQSPDKLLQNGNEKITPFGIKLRRTNYSLRFHSDPQNDQRRKKRYSAGDSFEGVPVPLIVADERESRNESRKVLSSSPTDLKKETVEKLLADTSNSSSDDVHSTSVPLTPVSSLYISSPSKERMVPRSPIVQKPSLAQKPSSPTPPCSSHSKLNRTNLGELPGQKLDKGRQDKEILEENIKVNTVNKVKEETETKEIKCSFPSITIPWREKLERRPDQIGRERPVLQSRHSLDGTRLMEKVEASQPLWITLALQKQKGFREQHATREERRQAREAKQADKISKENAPNIQIESYRSRSGSLQKLAAPEEKKCETVVTRLQRREQLKKSNTLPTSVTVEITETIPGPPLAKDNPKRFSTPDATAVSSEPAWLALAKRKSKAWSDCPQIIK
ncbi:capping protein-inhibiting regulator of actin dynamics isoform 1-T1 [Pelodytes ibericus]